MQRFIIRNLITVIIFIIGVILLDTNDLLGVHTVVALFIVEIIYNLLSAYILVIRPISKMIKLVEETDWESDIIDFDRFDKLNATSIFNLDILIKNYQYLVDIIENKIGAVHDLNYISEHDELTGCYNRVKLDKMIHKYESRNSVVVIFLDVNNLKLMNDTYGHDAGDALLRRTSKALNYWVNYGDIYRVGGDEFMVVISNKTKPEVIKLADRWYKKIGILNRDEDGFECKLAYGISESTREKGINFEDIMSKADDNMYIMKNKIKGGS